MGGGPGGMGMEIKLTSNAHAVRSSAFIKGVANRWTFSLQTASHSLLLLRPGSEARLKT